MSVITENNMGKSGDHLYNALLDAHKGLSEQQSHRLNARLVLILMNHIGEEKVVESAIDLAAQGVRSESPTDAP